MRKQKEQKAAHSKWRKAAILAVWLGVWQLGVVLVDNSILLAGPWEVLKALAGEAVHGEFWITIGCSFMRIGVGFLAGLLLGVLLAAGSARFSLLEELLAPVITLLKSVPVASFVVLLLIWWGAGRLSAIISFLVVFPNLYINTLEGIKSADRQLLEMAEVFHLPFFYRFFYIYRPALKPFLDSALKLSLGMSWKSGVAAEVIGTPDYSIGGALYLSKIYLDTAGVLAWTIVIIAVSFLFEKVIIRLTEAFYRWEPGCRPYRLHSTGARQLRLKEQTNSMQQERQEQEEAVVCCLHQVSKVYEGKKVLDKVSAVYEKPSCYFLTQPSGSGKTTLLRLIAGLEKPDEGQIEGNTRVSMVFQESRLCSGSSAVRNVELVTGDRRLAREGLLQVLDGESLDKPCGQLSGGMQRRVAIVRAMAADSDMVLLDEPFSGLDEENRRKTAAYIRENLNGRVLIMATHHPEEIAMVQPCSRN